MVIYGEQAERIREVDILAVAAVIICAAGVVNIGETTRQPRWPAFVAGVRRETVLLIAVFSMMGALFVGGKVVPDIIPTVMLHMLPKLL